MKAKLIANWKLIVAILVGLILIASVVLGVRHYKNKKSASTVVPAEVVVSPVEKPADKVIEKTADPAPAK